MQQIWHIFKKDVRRFWPQAVATLILLVWFAFMDGRRSDAVLPAPEGWLNLLLPFAWVYLLGLLIVEDPLVGDRQFWVTTPCGWRSLFGAKALFALAFVHVPFFAACASILWAQGFALLPNVPYLLWKQLLLFLMLTLPAMAVAALVKNATQYVLAAVLILGGLIVITSSLSSLMLYRATISGNNALALLVVGIGAVAVALVQYARRRTAVALSIAIAACLAGIIILDAMPRETSAAIECALWPAKIASHPGVSLDTSKPIADLPRRPTIYDPSGVMRSLALPVQFTSLPADTVARMNLLSLEIDGPDGTRYEASWPTRPPISQKVPIRAYMSDFQDQTPHWMSLLVNQALFDRLKDTSVIVKGSVQFDYGRRGAPVELATGARADLPGWGICSAILDTQRFGSLEELDVNCERPQTVPENSPVALRRADTGAEWKGRLRNALFYGGYPMIDWLSPVAHSYASFQVISPELAARPAFRWGPRREDIEKAKVVVTPEFPAGGAIAQFEFSNIRLADYVVPPPGN